MEYTLTLYDSIAINIIIYRIAHELLRTKKTDAVKNSNKVYLLLDKW